MSEPICRNCQNSGIGNFGERCRCGQSPASDLKPEPIAQKLETLMAAARKKDALRVQFAKLHAEAVIPRYAKPGDAGLDLTAIDDGTPIVYDQNKDVLSYREYRTGLAVEIPEGHVGLIFPRSSVTSREMILKNSVGVIDSGYRGEIKFRFLTPEHATAIYKKGDRIGQLVIMPYPTIEVEECSAFDLTQTARGVGGFGSSGQ